MLGSEYIWLQVNQICHKDSLDIFYAGTKQKTFSVKFIDHINLVFKKKTQNYFSLRKNLKIAPVPGILVRL